MSEINEPRPLAMFAIQGRTVARELASGEWQCAVPCGPLTPVECSHVAPTHHEMLKHGQAAHGWPKPEDCNHPNFAASVTVARVLDVAKFVAEVVVNCNVCGVPMRFVGVPAGFNYDRPMCDITGETLNAPIEPAIETELHARAEYTMGKIPRRH